MKSASVYYRNLIDFYNSLKSVRGNSVFAEAIKDFLINQKVSTFFLLVETLISQAKDNPEAIREILGDECYYHLLKLMHT